MKHDMLAKLSDVINGDLIDSDVLDDLEKEISAFTTIRVKVERNIRTLFTASEYESAEFRKEIQSLREKFGSTAFGCTLHNDKNALFILNWNGMKWHCICWGKNTQTGSANTLDEAIDFFKKIA